eukprot:g13750.t1
MSNSLGPLRSAAWHFQSWRAITDQVRGGVSTARLVAAESGDDPRARFEGTLDPSKLNAGFAGVNLESWNKFCGGLEGLSGRLPHIKSILEDLGNLDAYASMEAPKDLVQVCKDVSAIVKAVGYDMEILEALKPDAKSKIVLYLDQVKKALDTIIGDIEKDAATWEKLVQKRLRQEAEDSLAEVERRLGSIEVEQKKICLVETDRAKQRAENLQLREEILDLTAKLEVERYRVRKLEGGTAAASGLSPTAGPESKRLRLHAEAREQSDLMALRTLLSTTMRERDEALEKALRLQRVNRSLQELHQLLEKAMQDRERAPLCSRCGGLTGPGLFQREVYGRVGE